MSSRALKILKDLDIMGIIIISMTVFVLIHTFGCNIQTKEWSSIFSTTVSASAAMLALGGAVFVFRKEQIDKEIKDYQSRLWHFLSIYHHEPESTYYSLSIEKMRERSSETIEGFQPTDELESFFPAYERVIITREKQREVLKYWLSLFKDQIDIRRDLLDFLWYSVTLICSSIFINVVSLIMIDNSVVNGHLQPLLLEALPLILGWLSVWSFLISTYYVSRSIYKLSRGPV